MGKHLLFFSLFFYSLSLIGQEQNISNGNVFDGEPFIAINPNDPDHLLVAWMGWKLGNRLVIKTRASFDGGLNWSPVTDLGHTVNGYSSADPSIGFNHLGEVFVAYIDFNGLEANPITGGIYTRKSLDGGLSWQEATEVLHTSDDPGKLPIDRPWMVINQAPGPHQGELYVTSMNAAGVLPPFNPYLAVSTDDGTSFNWRYLDTINWLAGGLVPQPMPTPAIGSDGTFHAIYPSFVFSQSFLPQFILASSTNGSDGFDYQPAYASGIGDTDSLAKKGYLLRANPSNPDHLVFVTLLNLHGDLDVYLIETFDKGENWLPPYRVNDDPVGNNRMQDLLWADFDLDGDLIISWRDRRNGLDSSYQTSSEIWAAFRRNGEVDTSPNFQISEADIDYDDVLAAAGNDFMCIQLQEDTLYAVWGDPRDGSLDIWFQQLSISGVVLSSHQLASERVINIEVYPNPSDQNVQVNASTAINSIKIYAVAGELVHEKKFSPLSRQVNIKLPDQAGTYWLAIATDVGTEIKKVIRQ